MLINCHLLSGRREEGSQDSRSSGESWIKTGENWEGRTISDKFCGWIIWDDHPFTLQCFFFLFKSILLTWSYMSFLKPPVFESWHETMLGQLVLMVTPWASRLFQCFVVPLGCGYHSCKLSATLRLWHTVTLFSNVSTSCSASKKQVDLPCSPNAKMIPTGKVTGCFGLAAKKVLPETMKQENYNYDKCALLIENTRNVSETGKS